MINIFVFSFEDKSTLRFCSCLEANWPLGVEGGLFYSPPLMLGRAAIGRWNNWRGSVHACAFYPPHHLRLTIKETALSPKESLFPDNFDIQHHITKATKRNTSNGKLLQSDYNLMAKLFHYEMDSFDYMFPSKLIPLW